MTCALHVSARACSSSSLGGVFDIVLRLNNGFQSGFWFILVASLTLNIMHHQRTSGFVLATLFPPTFLSSHWFSCPTLWIFKFSCPTLWIFKPASQFIFSLDLIHFFIFVLGLLVKFWFVFNFIIKSQFVMSCFFHF